MTIKISSWKNERSIKFPSAAGIIVRLMVIKLKLLLAAFEAKLHGWCHWQRPYSCCMLIWTNKGAVNFINSLRAKGYRQFRDSRLLTTDTIPLYKLVCRLQSINSCSGFTPKLALVQTVLRPKSSFLQRYPLLQRYPVIHNACLSRWLSIQLPLE